MYLSHKSGVFSLLYIYISAHTHSLSQTTLVLGICLFHVQNDEKHLVLNMPSVIRKCDALLRCCPKITSC